jgi:hypothetical protein
MKIMSKIAAASVAALLVPASAFAATGNIPFSGSVANTCVITVGSSGTLGVSTDFATLGSSEAGGALGSANVLATGAGFSLSADAPTAWDSAPATGGTNVSFAATYAATGPTTIPTTNGGTLTALNRGNHSVSVGMTAQKTVLGETFESGSYDATVVLRCE